MRQTIRRQPARRAAAMMETVLTLPFIITILAFTMYFGLGMMRVQHSQVMDRYEAWRVVYQAPGPHQDVHQEHTLLNQAFLADEANRVTRGGHGRVDVPDDANNEIIHEAYNYSDDAGGLFDQMVDDFPAGYTIRLSARYDESVPFFQQAFGDTNIRHRHTRIGNDWRYANGGSGWSSESWRYGGSRVTNTHSIAETFFLDIDRPLESFASGGNNYAAMIRGYYRDNPGYRGPQVN